MSLSESSKWNIARVTAEASLFILDQDISVWVDQSTLQEMPKEHVLPLLNNIQQRRFI